MGEGVHRLAQRDGQFGGHDDTAASHLQRQGTGGVLREEVREFGEPFEAGPDGDLGAVPGDGR
ncbi:hypothetical protein GCM10009528_24100 [Kineococcus aurantiacus]